MEQNSMWPLEVSSAGPHGSILVVVLHPTVPSEGELKLPTALVLHLPVFRFVFHMCPLMMFHL